MTRWTLPLTLLFVVTSALVAETSVSDLDVTSDTTEGTAIDADAFNADLLAHLTALDTKGAVGFLRRSRTETRGAVRSTRDAAQACEINGWETLVYGQLTRTVGSLDVEIHVYSHPDRKVLKTILLRSTPEDYPELVSDIAQKIYGFFAVALVLTKTQVKYAPESNAWVTNHGAFWWGTVGPWADTVVAVAGYAGTLGFRWGDPFWTNGEWAATTELGLRASFLYGFHQNAVVPAQWYDTDLGPYLAVNMVWQRQQELSWSVAPSARVHALNLQPLYEGVQQRVLTWYGGTSDLTYRFWVNAERTFGVAVSPGVSVFATKPLYFDYRLGVALAWKGGL